MKLNLGSGNKKIDGFINLDIDESTNPDVVCDLNKGVLPFQDNTFDEILAFHILEHIGDGFMDLMKDIYRVSKPDANIHIRIPHHNHWTFHTDPTHVRSITVNTFELFSKEWCEQDKKVNNGSSCYANDVDFKIVNYSHRPEKEYENLTPDELFKTSLKYNNVIIESYIQLKVIK